MSTMVPYYEPAAEKAKELTKGCTSQLMKYRIITEYVTRCFRYDYVRAILIPKKNGKPDVPRTWEKRMGICLDIASMTTGMLRAVCIKANMCTGKADGKNHAWVEAKVAGQKYIYDHDGKAKTYVTQYRY